MTDYQKLITDLKRAGDGWNCPGERSYGERISLLQGLCRQAAAALEVQQTEPMKETIKRAGRVLQELGKRMQGDV